MFRDNYRPLLQGSRSTRRKLECIQRRFWPPCHLRLFNHSTVRFRVLNCSKFHTLCVRRVTWTRFCCLMCTTIQNFAHPFWKLSAF
jgi:hypothetical protein